jgi:hypothetical protein
MDELVRQAMVKWPHVPNCFGWLGLDTRGNWYLRDESAQTAGGFASGVRGAKGSLLTHEKLINFIQNNYDCDESGQWYFQNGPQRVYVELAATPWIWRVDDQWHITSHCGKQAEIHHAFMDEHGWLYLKTSLGFGLVHPQDVMRTVDPIETGAWPMKEPISLRDIETICGFLRSPKPEKSV